VDHECVLADGVHVGPGAHLGGRVQVGRAAWIGIGAVVRDRARVGAGALVGAGAVVIRDVPDHVVAYGVPARTMRAGDADG
jgi:acetyltransferase-like isoleucine patch superfamily enzyme